MFSVCLRSPKDVNRSGRSNGSKAQITTEESSREKENKSSQTQHPRLLNAGVTLEMKPLWEQFNELGTEMIVTKAGRYELINSLDFFIRMLE